MNRAVAWVLNLDAEDELAGGGAHTPTAAMEERIKTLVPRLAGLIRPGDQVIWPTLHPDPLPRGSSFQGRAWCPTRWAVSRLERAGVEIPPSPPVDVLRAVNHRRFSHHLGQTLPGAGYAEDESELEQLLDPSHSCWLVKRAFGYAGRGRKKLRAGEQSAAERAWLAASFRTGDGLQVEPWVARELDCALHGWLTQSGALTLGQPTLQEVDEHGAWVSTSVAPAGALGPDEFTQLSREANRAALALHRAGYFGPFGIDGFRWRDARGQLHFQPRSELNARYSMGWAIGMGDLSLPD